MPMFDNKTGEILRFLIESRPPSEVTAIKKLPAADRPNIENLPARGPRKGKPPKSAPEIALRSLWTTFGDVLDLGALAGRQNLKPNLT